MAKMFDKVSDSFLDAIKSVTEKKLTPAELKKREEVAKAIERDNPDMPMPKKMAIATATAKKVAEAKLDPVDQKALKGSHADRKDKDIDNDGDSDKTDEYLHNRRKAVKKAIAKKMKEEAEQIDELSSKKLVAYINKSDEDRSNRQHKARKHYEKGEYNKGHDEMRKVINRETGANKAEDELTRRKLAKEEVEQIDELSTKALGSYVNAATDSLRTNTIHAARTGDKKSKNIARKRYQGMYKAVNKMAKEEAEQIDEISTKLAIDYSAKAADARGHKKLSTSKLDKRYKSMALAHEKIRARHAQVPTTEEAELTPEEIAMIEAKMAGVADDALPGDQHMCATKVFHKEWKEGTPVPTMHADPDDEGLIEWYDVMFDHGIERVMTEDMEILDEKMHGHKKMKEEKAPFEGGHERKGSYKDEYGNTIKDANYPKHLAKKAAQKVAMKANEEVEGLDEAISPKDYHATSEKSQFGGYRPKVVHKEKGHKMYHGQHSYKTPEIAAKHAEVYLKTYADRGDRASQNASTIFANANKKHLYVKEEADITEARGRPRKENKDFTIHPKTKEKLMHNNPAHMARLEKLHKTGALPRPKTEAGQNIITQLRKASTSMTGGMKVNFTHGASAHVSNAHAQKLLDKHAGMRPHEKEKFQKSIGHSHAQLKQHV